ncbi:WD40-repeat-containing domain protein [Suillus spraguei]|nr:WD40-repeat-containing domain protein [Suillus spraguei]
MPDSFFASTKTRKRKRSDKSGSQDTKLTSASARKGLRGAADEELNSDRTDSEGGGIDDINLRADDQPETSGDEDEQETPAEKRLRLAKLYLESVKDGLAEGEELISQRLRQDVLEHSYDFTSTSPLRCRRISKGKEKALPQDIQGHTDEILSLAVSSDGRYLASGSKDRRVGVWDVEKDEWVKGFGGHKDSVSSVAFRKGTQQLYTGSFDRTVKLFDLSAMDMKTAVTAGARDRTIRFWKIADESHAIRECLKEDEEHANGMEVDGPKSNKMCRNDDETTFVSGETLGISICLWNTQKKKPVYIQTLCHGFHEVQSSTEGLVRTPRWITAVASLPLFRHCFRSWDGDVRFWKLDQKLRSFSLGALDNACWKRKGTETSHKDIRSACIIVGLGQEHRLGRLSIKGENDTEPLRPDVDIIACKMRL